MVKPNKNCMSNNETAILDKLIDDKVHGSALNKKELSALTEMRESAVFCVAASDAPTEKKKRKPSKYNIFIGDCMRGGGSDMKTCAIRYKEKKANEKP